MSKYQIILFDLDGTLTDPKEGILNSIDYALQYFEIKVEERERLVSFIGPPLKESFQKYFSLSPAQAWQAVQFYREYFTSKGMFENIIYPGIPQLLADLNQHNRLLYVATSKPTVYSEQILAHFNLRHYFQKIIGSNLDGTRVSKTEVIEETIKQLGFPPKETIVMVGDREHDIIGARENQIDSIAVTYGYGSEEELKAAGPTFIVKSTKELTKLLLTDYQ